MSEERCRACRAENLTAFTIHSSFLEGKDPQYWQDLFCGNCGTVSHYPTSDQVRFDYTNSDFRQLGYEVHPPITLPWATVTFQRHKHITELLKPCLPAREQGDLLDHLDFGGYNGFTAFGLRQTLGLRSTIADLDPTGLRIAKALDMDVIPLADQDLPSGTFDLVTSVHVVEHIDDPAPTIEMIRRSLKPSGGLFYCEVPNLLGYPMVNVSHLSAFSVEGILQLIEGAGFTVLTAGFCSTPAVARDFHYRHSSPREAIYVIASTNSSLRTENQSADLERYRDAHSIDGLSALASELQKAEARILLHTSAHDLRRGIKSVLRGGYYSLAALLARVIRSPSIIRIATRTFESFRSREA